MLQCRDCGWIGTELIKSIDHPEIGEHPNGDIWDVCPDCGSWDLDIMEPCKITMHKPGPSVCGHWEEVEALFSHWGSDGKGRVFYNGVRWSFEANEIKFAA